MVKMLRRRIGPGAVIALVALALMACAARGPQAKAQIGALTLGEAVLMLDQTEYDCYKAKLYSEATHRAMGAGVLKVLYATRAYERAASAWPLGSPKPAGMTAALGDLLRALDDVAKALPAEGVARTRLEVVMATIRAVAGDVVMGVGNDGE